MPERRVWLTRSCSRPLGMWPPATLMPISAAACSNSASLAKAAGKSGGFRTIILFRGGSHSFFAHGFAESDKANVSPKELKALTRLADVLLGYSGIQLKAAEAAGELIEVESNGDKKETN